MSGTDDEVAKVAAGLTKMQRDTIVRLRDDIDGTFWFPRGSARGIPVELKRRTIAGHCLTPLGLAVRQHLQETRHDD